MDAVYLRPNVQIEPLVDSWYAWSHLIPPATAARNLTHRYLPILSSYISEPHIHASAVKNPRMLGGPFIDYDGKRVDEIRDLLIRTKARRSYLSVLSKAIEELDLLLSTKAKGGSLQSLYPLIPKALRGYVELTYDRNNHASFRFIEPLLYNSAFFTSDGQSFELSFTQGDNRSFVLSTPRLPRPEALNLSVTFSDPTVDRLFSSKLDPQPFESLLEGFEIPAEKEALFRSFFTATCPPAYIPYLGRGVRWRYFGHACILIETNQLSLLFDPVVSYSYQADIPRYTYQDLPERLDYIFITHNHQDHVLLETMLQLRHKTACVVVPRGGIGTLEDPSLKLTLEAIGFTHVLELDELGTFSFDGGSVIGVPFLGEHSDLSIRTKLAYLITLNNHRLLFAADSCNIDPELYQNIHSLVGDIDALFIGMECDGAPLSWLYGCLLSQRLDRASDESRRLSGSNFSQAYSLVTALRCKRVYVYAMGQEPWLTHIMSIRYGPDSNPIIQSNLLIERCTQNGILTERLFGEREMFLK